MSLSEQRGISRERTGGGNASEARRSPHNEIRPADTDVEYPLGMGA